MNEDIDSDREESDLLRLQQLMKFDADNIDEEDEYASLDEFNYWL